MSIIEGTCVTVMLISSVTKTVSIRKPWTFLTSHSFAVQLTWSSRFQITSLTKVLKCANLVTLKVADEADVLKSKQKVGKFLQECKFNCQSTVEWCSIASDAPCISLLRFMCAHVGGFLRLYITISLLLEKWIVPTPKSSFILYNNYLLRPSRVTW